MSSSHINDPQHWRARAEEMRTLAAQADDLDAQATMLKVAEQYDKLARRAEERSDGTPNTQQQQQRQPKE